MNIKFKFPVLGTLPGIGIFSLHYLIMRDFNARYKSILNPYDKIINTIGYNIFIASDII